jgi:serine/threonine-protein kinase
LIQRDITPANLAGADLGGRYDVLKVLDFGLVRAVGKLKDAASSLDQGISGSPLYMSPEEASPTAGDPSDHRGDIYSLGATAYYLLSGQPPFSGGNSIAVMAAHQTEAPQPLRELYENIPADVERIVLRCLAKNPADRFADVEALDQSLAACACAGQWTPADATAWWKQALLNPS